MLLSVLLISFLLLRIHLLPAAQPMALYAGFDTGIIAGGEEIYPK